MEQGPHIPCIEPRKKAVGSETGGSAALGIITIYLCLGMTTATYALLPTGGREGRVVAARYSAYRGVGWCGEGCFFWRMADDLFEILNVGIKYYTYSVLRTEYPYSLHRYSVVAKRYQGTRLPAMARKTSTGACTSSHVWCLCVLLLRAITYIHTTYHTSYYVPSNTPDGSSNSKTCLLCMAQTCRS